MTQATALPRTLQHVVEETLDDADAKFGVVITRRGDQEPLVSLNGCQSFMAASIAKLGIVAFALDAIQRGELDFSTQLKFKSSHRRPGTGVLRHFRTGLTLDVQTLLQLILVESDNTATNTLLAALGTQLEINNWLKSELGVVSTGLSDRNSDRLFESDLIRPVDVLTIFAAILESDLVCGALRRSHFTSGLRGFVEEDTGSRYQDLLEAKIWGRVSPRFFQHNLIGRVVTSPLSQAAATKEGVLPAGITDDGASYLNEVGWFFASDLLVVVCSQNGTAEQFTELGELLSHWRT